jgi:hypothetical protein
LDFSQGTDWTDRKKKNCDVSEKYDQYTLKNRRKPLAISSKKVSGGQITLRERVKYTVSIVVSGFALRRTHWT